jgi:hypothetical protein
MRRLISLVYYRESEGVLSRRLASVEARAGVKAATTKKAVTAREQLQQKQLQKKQLQQKRQRRQQQQINLHPTA